MQCSAAVLRGVGVQAVITEYLIKNTDSLFTDSTQNYTISTDFAARQSSACLCLVVKCVVRPALVLIEITSAYSKFCIC